MTNLRLSLLRIIMVIPYFKSHNLKMSARVYFMKTVNGGNNVSVTLVTQTTQTAHTLYLDRLSRPIVSRHAMLRFIVMFFD